ncbi:MAG: hypothetical protein FWC10_08480 [Lentimicrobiaceae bacterium]|nr:hypothetical protein [Lentimicrobiaceae bacterium]
MENTKKNDIAEIEKSVEKTYASFEKFEEEGKQNILKHFDRIHDKLFTVNTVFIAGFIALIMFSDVPRSFMLLPIFNMIYLIWIEYRMVAKSRFEASITHKSKIEIEKWGKSIHKTNLFSFLSIISTLIVTIVFVYFLLQTK